VAETAYQHRDLSIDQQLALRTAATRLAREFDGTYGADTTERFLRTGPVTDGARILRPPRRRPGGRLIRRLRARERDQSVGGGGDG
jgi:hypothetical protein